MKGESRDCSICGSNFIKPTHKQAMCQACKRIYDRNYHANRSDEKKKIKSQKQYEWIQRNKKNVIEYLMDKGCENCPENDYVVLEFDHIDPSTKSFNISDGMSKRWDLILKEIAKCRILCCNCHRRHTAKQQNWYSFL